MRALRFALLFSVSLIISAKCTPLLAGEVKRIGDLHGRSIGLIFRVTDLSGNPVAIAGKVEQMRVKETETEITIDLAADVLFEFDKADVLPAAEETLKKAATFVRDAKGVVRVEGHTDSKGDDQYNMALSLKRAESIRNWFLTSGGITAVQFAVEGAGEKKPVAANEKPDGSDDPDGRQKNRRVTITVRKQ